MVTKRFLLYRRFRLSNLTNGLAIGFGVAIIVLLFWKGDFFAQARLRVNNILYQPAAVSDTIVIITIDDDSLQRYGRTPTEWDRSLHAKLVEIVNAGGARVITFDLLFAEPTTTDATFAEAIRTARDSRTALRTVLPIVGLEAVPLGSGAFQFQSILSPQDALADVVHGVGIVNGTPDADGATRWIPLRVIHDTQPYYALSLATYLAYLRIPPTAAQAVIQFDDGVVTLPSQTQIMVDTYDRMLLNYFSSPKQRNFETVSYQAVINGDIDPQRFIDKIVLVGLANTEGQTDRHQVPLGINGFQMAGVEIHANAIETLLQGKALAPQPAWSFALIVLLVSPGAAVFYYQMPNRFFGVWVLIASGLLGLMAVFISLVVFITAQTVVSLFLILLTIILPAPLVMIQHDRQEALQRTLSELLRLSVVNASEKNLSADETLAAIADDLRALLGNTSSEVWLWDKDKDLPVCAFGTTQDNADSTLLRQAFASQQQMPVGRDLLKPIIWQGVVVAVLRMRSVPRLRYREQRLLDIFALQTAPLIQNVKLHQAALEYGELKTFLLRTASHDLKNPLTGIINLATFLESQMASDPAREPEREIMDEIVRAGHEMRGIINDVLLLERAANTHLERETIDLRPLLMDLEKRYQSKASTKEQKLVVQLPEQSIFILGHASLLGQALGNLIDNALKYTPAQGQIAVGCEIEADTVVVQVADNGLGIPEKEQPRIFEEFFRVRTPQTRHIKGTGLGLSLVKIVAEAHQGQVWFTSLEDHGSTFYMRLPRA